MLENNGIADALRRAAYSVPANIVEGTQREHPRESLHFCSIASASLGEVGYGRHAAKRLGYLLPAEYEEFEKKIRMIAAPLQGLMARYRRGSTLAPPTASAASRPPRPTLTRRTK